MSAEHFRLPPDGGPSGELGKIFQSAFETGRTIVGLAKIVIVAIPEDFHLHTSENS